MSGNEAMSAGAMAAGCRFYAGYPITPASDILSFMEKEMPRFGGVAVQTEDEISAIAMYDLMGKQIQKFNFQSPETVVEVDMEDFRSGMYIIKVSSGSRVASSKIVKE